MPRTIKAQFWVLQESGAIDSGPYGSETEAQLALAAAEAAEAAALVAPLPPPIVTTAVDNSGVPVSVTRLQARLALFNAHLLPQVEAAVASAGGAAAIWYADAVNWRRDDPTLAQLAGALGLSSEQVDSLFTAAAQL